MPNEPRTPSPLASGPLPPGASVEHRGNSLRCPSVPSAVGASAFALPVAADEIRPWKIPTAPRFPITPGTILHLYRRALAVGEANEVDTALLASEPLRATLWQIAEGIYEPAAPIAARVDQYLRQRKRQLNVPVTPFTERRRELGAEQLFALAVWLMLSGIEAWTSGDRSI